MVGSIRAAGNSEVVAVASRDSEKARAFAKSLSIPCAYGSYEELLADPQVDAIYNSLPTSLHAPWSIQCAQARKATLCEKPMALNAGQARAVLAAFAEKQVLFSEGFMYRYHPLTRKIKELLEGKRIGAPVAIRASFFVSIPNGDIRWKAETGGGALLDLGCYCAGIMRHLTGAEPVSARAVAHWKERGTVDQTLGGVLLFPSGTIGDLACGLRSSFDCSYEVMGEKGRLLVDRGGMVAWPGESFKIKLWADDAYEEVSVPEADPYASMVKDFADAVLTGREPAFPAADGIKNLEDLDQLRASAVAEE